MTDAVRVLHLVGSPVDEFHAELSRLYARDALAAWPVEICPTAITDRTVFLDAAAAASGMAEMRGSAARSAEIELRKVWAWIAEKANHE